VQNPSVNFGSTQSDSDKVCTAFVPVIFVSLRRAVAGRWIQMCVLSGINCWNELSIAVATLRRCMEETPIAR
jgi:hypothetical protein